MLHIFWTDHRNNENALPRTGRENTLVDRIRQGQLREVEVEKTKDNLHAKSESTHECQRNQDGRGDWG